MNCSKVICIGEALIDSIISQTGTKRINYLGGAPANVVCALSKLKIKSSFIGNIGDDSFGVRFLELFKKLEIDTTILQIDKKYETRIVEVTRDKTGDRSFLGFAENKYDFFADEALDINFLKSKTKRIENIFSNSKFIITGTILLASAQSAESINYLLNFANKFEPKIVIDLNWREVFWHKSLSAKSFKREDQIMKIMEFLSFADILKLSREESEMFFGNSNPVTISKSFQKSPDVVITDGGEPIKWFINDYEGISDNAFSGKVIDTTGAGDAFLAGLVSQLLYLKNPINKSEIDRAVKFASACGFLTCQGEGAIEPQPVYEQVQSFLSFYDH
tara:strand:+ start:492 stop:1490 length:999 start_codon:yes stop_codon:yes gene_type:complete